MLTKEIVNKSLFFLLSILPLSVVVGSSISLINIFLFGIIIIFLISYERNFFFFKNNSLKLLFFLYFYLIFNSFISLDYSVGVYRNLGFLRFIIMFIGINYFFYKYPYSKNILIIWVIFIIIFLIDVYIERWTGSNIFGWGKVEINGIPQPHGLRVVSFFKDEPIAGSFLSGFVLMLFGYLLSQKKVNNFFSWIFIFISIVAILITGERSNTIKIILGFTVMFIFLDIFKTKTKLFGLSIIFLIMILISNQSNYLKYRYLSIVNNFQSKEKMIKFIDNNLYFKLYKSGISVFKNKPIFGVGNKNYRIETCKSKIDQKKYNYICTTHPHQLYIEFLAEHGLVGSIILLSIFFTLIFKILKNIIISKNYIQLGCFCFIVFTFTPLIPSGSFFTDFNLTLFWINFSLMFASSRKTNIFIDRNKK